MSLRLGDIAPDFTADSSVGQINFHEYLGDGWGILFPIPPIIHRFVPPNLVQQPS